MNRPATNRILASLIVTTLLTSVLVFAPAQKAYALCAANNANLGQINGSFTVPAAGEYRIWSRIQPSATAAANNSYTLEIDDSTCNITVGDATVPMNQWTWVDFKDGNTNSKSSVTLAAGTHTFKAYGREAGVLLDKIVLSGDPNCIPTPSGDNCAVGPPVTPPADTIAPVVSIITPTEGQTVSGQVAVNVSATDNTAVTKVEILVDGQLRSTLTAAPYNTTIDTTSLTNSGHDIVARASDAASNSNSQSRHITVQNGDSQKPTAVSTLAATVQAYNRVDLSWTPSTDNVGVTGYRVIRNGTVVASIGTSITYSDTTTLPNTSYTYQLLAVDAAGNASDLSNQVSVTTPGAPDTVAPTAPGNVTATAVTNSQINISWSASSDAVGVAGYDVYRNGSRVGSVASTSFGDAGLSPATSYTYYVTAKDSSGNVSPHSASVTATTMVLTNANGALQGTVSANGSALPKVTVSFTVGGRKRSATTNSAGSYSFTNVPAGKYAIKYSAKGYLTQTVNITIQSGSTLVQNINLSRR